MLLFFNLRKLWFCNLSNNYFLFDKNAFKIHILTRGADLNLLVAFMTFSILLQYESSSLYIISIVEPLLQVYTVWVFIVMDASWKLKRKISGLHVLNQFF